MLVALGILSVGLLAVMGSLYWGIEGMGRSERYTTVQMVAESLLDGIRGRPDFAALTEDYRDGPEVRRSVSGHPELTCNLRVEPLADDPDRLRKISVTVFWQEAGRGEGSLTLVGFRRRP